MTFFRNSMFLACLAWGALAATLAAQDDPAAADASQPPAAAAAEDAEDAGPETLLREQSVYVPYNKLREVFEREGRGVFLPYEKFQELWKQARASQVPEAEHRPPVGALIAEIENEAGVEQDVFVVSARLKIEILGKGWHEVPLRLGDAAIRSATIDDAPAHVLFDPQAGYKLLVKHDLAEPARTELRLEYAKAFAKSPGQNSVSIEAPQAPINRWRITVPQAGAKINVQPLIAASEAPAGAEDAEPAEETVVLAFVGAAPTVRVDWTPKAEGATGLEALATVQAQQEVSVQEGVIRARTQLAYDISRAELSQLKIEVPADYKVTGVFDPNVRGWEVAEDGERQTISIELFEPARGAQNILVELEKFASDVAMRDLQVPVVRGLDVGRQQGVVVVDVDPELRAEASSRSGLLQLDEAELPASLRGRKWLFAYRYATLPFELALSVEKVQPRIRAAQWVEAYLQPEKLTLDLLALLTIERAGVFQLEFDVPEGYKIVQVEGVEAAGAAAAARDTFHTEGENNTRLKVNLSRKAIGRVGLLIQLERVLDDPNLLSPTGQASQIPLPLPRVATEVESLEGRVIVYAPESLRVNPLEQEGLRSVSLADAREGGQSLRQDRFPGLREVLSLAHARQAVQLSLDVQRRRPQVTVRQLLDVQVKSGVIRYDARFFYEVLYSGVKSLRIDVPAQLADKINSQSPQYPETTIAPAPEDLAEGYVAWSFAGNPDFLGSATIHLSWEEKVDELEVGKTTSHAIPVLTPRDVDRAWGQIVIAKDETLEVRANDDVEGLLPIDPQHDLMPGVQRTDAARAFEFHDAWSLTVAATRYELEEVKRTSIERAVLRQVVTRSNRISVQALYRLRSAVQRLAIKLPGEAEFDTDPLRINGVARNLEHGDQDQKFIPLADQNPAQPVLVELRYTIPGGPSQLGFPEFPAQPPIQSRPAMQKVIMCVYLPRETLLLSSSGPWTNEEADWYRRLNGPTRPHAGQTGDAHWLEWVSEGVPLENNRLSSFPTDGRLYTFTSLRPPPAPEGALKLWTMNQFWLNTAMFSVLALVGVAGLRQAAATKLTALALLLVALVLVGVLAPTFAMQVADVWLGIGVSLLVVVWALFELAKYLPRMAPAAAAAPAPPPVQPAVAAEAPADAAEEAGPAADGGSPFASEDEAAPPSSSEKPADQPPRGEGGDQDA